MIYRNVHDSKDINDVTIQTHLSVELTVYLLRNDIIVDDLLMDALELVDKFLRAITLGGKELKDVKQLIESTELAQIIFIEKPRKREGFVLDEEIRVNYPRLKAGACQ